MGIALAGLELFTKPSKLENPTFNKRGSLMSNLLRGSFFEILKTVTWHLDAPKVGHVIVLHGFGNRSLETLDGYTKYRAAYGNVPRINLYIHTYKPVTWHIDSETS
jgi:hypothetical protein